MQQNLANSIRRHLTRYLLSLLIEQLRTRTEADAPQLSKQIQLWLNARQHEDAARTSAYLDTVTSSTMLRALSAVGVEASYAEVRLAARSCLDLIAEAYGMARGQLEDQMVPTCGLGGELVFDYGPRQFTLVLGNAQRPLLRGQHRRHYTGRPRRHRGDDEGLVRQAWEGWRRAKRTLSAESRLQTRRLELAMIEGRRWTPADFARDLLGHPLLSELARHLIWAGYGPDGARLAVFCLADQLSPTDEDYAPRRLEEFAAVGLPHPAEVPPERRLRWFELLSDFHIVPLFAQAARPVYTLSEAERGGHQITRFSGIRLHRQEALGLLVSRGWEGHYSGGANYVVRSFEHANLTVGLKISGSSHQDTQIEHCCALRGIARMQSDAAKWPPALPLRDLPAPLLSEALGDLVELTNNPKYLAES